jgi:putative transposase
MRGTKAAIGATLLGAAWQRCHTHFARNLLTKVPRGSQEWVATAVRSIFAQPDAASVVTQHAQVEFRVGRMGRLARVSDDVLAFAAFPKEHWKQISSNNPQERLNR